MSARLVTLIAGFPGSGKSRVSSVLERQTGASWVECRPSGALPALLDQGDILLELDSGTAPADAVAGLSTSGGYRHAGLIVVVDVVNLASQLASAGGDWLRHHLFQADLIVLTCTDIGDGAAARQILSGLTQAEITDMPALPTRTGELSSGPALRFRRWHYCGGAKATRASVEALLRRPPAGLWRLKGQVRARERGLSIDLSGRRALIEPVDLPEETALTGLGLPPFQTTALDMAWARMAADAEGVRGIFGYR